MAKVTTLLNRILALVFLLFGWTRVAVARLVPWYQPVQKPAAVKVFALTEEEWMQLRSGQAVAAQEQSAPKGADEQKDSSKKGEDSNKSADEKKDQAKSAECGKSNSKPDDKKGESPKEAKDSAKPGECDQGPGGGDGDMGGGGG